MVVDNETMRQLTILLLLALPSVFAETPDEKDAIATVQKTFNGMAAHDAAMIRATMLPEARIYGAREEGPARVTTGEEFATQIAGSKNDVVERFTSTPSVSIRGRLAQVWGEYEFLRDLKFTHCGIDSVSLFKTAEGWKIATLVYTMETTGCKGH